MSMFPEQPFDEREERYMLAEILKDSPIPPGNLLRVIQGEGIRPRWTEIALPYGRSVSACQKAFDNLYSRVFQVPFPPIGPPPQPSPSSKARKRPLPGAEPSMGLNRELQPRTPGFATVNEPTESTAYPSGLLDNVDQRKKKRGRPSKAEIEVKAAEYAARGEPYPPPRKSKNPKSSAEGIATTGSSITFTPVTMGPSGAEGSALGNKRTPKAKAYKDDPVVGYGAAASPVNPFHNEMRIANQAQGSVFQASQPGMSEAVLPGVIPTAQNRTMEERDVSESYQQQGAQPNRPETFHGHDGSQSEHRHEAGDDALRTSSTAHQQPTTGHDSPNVRHSPEQK